MLVLITSPPYFSFFHLDRFADYPFIVLQSPMDVDARLAELGYVYIEGPSGNPSDWVLRQTADNSKGFEWKGAWRVRCVETRSVPRAQLWSLCIYEVMNEHERGR